MPLALLKIRCQHYEFHLPCHTGFYMSMFMWVMFQQYVFFRDLEEVQVCVTRTYIFKHFVFQCIQLVLGCTQALVSVMFCDCWLSNLRSSSISVCVEVTMQQSSMHPRYMNGNRQRICSSILLMKQMSLREQISCPLLDLIVVKNMFSTIWKCCGREIPWLEPHPAVETCCRPVQTSP